MSSGESVDASISFEFLCFLHKSFCSFSTSRTAGFASINLAAGGGGGGAVVIPPPSPGRPQEPMLRQEWRLKKPSVVFIQAVAGIAPGTGLGGLPGLSLSRTRLDLGLGLLLQSAGVLYCAAVPFALYYRL